MVERRLGEFELIERYFAPLADGAGAAGLKDDAAVYTPQDGHDIVVSKDMLASGVHFFPEDPPAAIAAKALRVNLSDIASKGARPTAYALGLGLASDVDEHWIAEFCKGLGEDQRTYGITLLGGDTIKTGGRMVLSVTFFGELPRGSTVRRTSASEGDYIYLTGTVGDAALGLQLRLSAERAGQIGLSEDDADFLLNRYLLPQPRVVAADAVRQFASASMDVSDGLAADLEHMCKAADLWAHVELDQLPLSRAAGNWVAAKPSDITTVITGGDDYELLCAVAPNHAEGFERAVSKAGVPVTRIGRFVSPEPTDPRVQFLSSEGVLDLHGVSGYRHV
ncbi:thiamine-phosphate kinase [Pseudovibrio exalbescens]|uniref:thiamine-phosphate kinase n=1 Tax=Pseudovibrio exalbescens TaxID=197461 RepID=UPI00236513BB|nr:thiamine-phosphate kinase [Pseudovibrio exalbescens]MDD7908391.1 thiamine-phosphate kinase [Pseudovibrio exalbescens]